ncbi:MAG TPA: hypothetical protein VFY24_04600 [Azospira sp.]|nr:hypothetical protein [Azospira sp.]
MKALLRRLLGRPAPSAKPRSDIERARQLIAAIDAGGIPLDPLPIRRIAEGLGLEVSPRAPMDETIARIRAALKRCAEG